jgi:DNA-binding HxlR family transcriptional regulator
VGEQWTLLILREAFFGVRRYGQFVRNLNIPRPTLSARLKSLVDAGLLQRVPYAEDREEYRLTEAGLELFPAIVILMKWGTGTCRIPTGRRSSWSTARAARWVMPTSPAGVAGRRSPRTT